jgi:hypothetical protein
MGFETFENELPQDDYIAVAEKGTFTVPFLCDYIVEALAHGECRWFNHDATLTQIRKDVSEEDLHALLDSLGDTPEVRGFLGLL